MKIDELIAQGTEERASAAAKQAEQAAQAEARTKLFARLDGLVAVIDQCFLLRRDWQKKDRAVIAILAIVRQASKKPMKAKYLQRLGFYACRAYGALHNNDLKKHITRFESELMSAFDGLTLAPWLISLIQGIQKRSLKPNHGAGVHKTIRHSAARQGPEEKGVRRRPRARREHSAPRETAMGAALAKAGVTPAAANEGAATTATAAA